MGLPPCSFCGENWDLKNPNNTICRPCSDDYDSLRPGGLVIDGLKDQLIESLKKEVREAHAKTERLRQRGYRMFVLSEHHDRQAGGCEAPLTEDGTCENPQCPWPDISPPPIINDDDIPF